MEACWLSTSHRFNEMYNDQISMTKANPCFVGIGVWTFVILGFGAIAPDPYRALIAAETAPAKQKLLDRTPFDEITLNQASGGRKLEVLPLKLPQGPQAALPQGKLKVRLVSRPMKSSKSTGPISARFVSSSKSS